MDAHSSLLEKLGKDELEQRISSKIKSMHGFLTKEAAIRIIFNELRIPGEKAQLSEISEGANRSVISARISSILPIQQFESGKKMRKILLSDSSGERELKLWNADVDALNNVHLGDLVELSGIYCKNNELSLGYSGSMKVTESASFTNLDSILSLEGSKVNVRGFVESADGRREFEKNGEKKKISSFTLSDGKNKARAVIWEISERGASLSIGSEVKIENALSRNGELHIDSSSRILVKKKKDGLRGKVESISADQESLKLSINGKEHQFNRADALFIFNSPVAQDISLQTIAELKKPALIGKEVFIEIKDGKPQRISIAQ